MENINTILNAVGLLFILCGIFYLILKKIFSSKIVAIWQSFGLTLAILCAAIISVMTIRMGLVPQKQMLTLLPHSVIASINFIIIPFLYWYDKRRSQVVGASRIPENSLHFFSFLGGGPSAFFCQRYFRHKTQKKKFQIISVFSYVSSLFLYYIIW